MLPYISVQLDDFDPGAELGALSAARRDIGGIASFIGLVRDHADDRMITAMTLEHYPGMTERQIGQIAAEAARRWPLLACRIIHRYGRLLPGDRIVFVGVASSHRQAALEACGFLIDWLKTQAPFWKLEESPKGDHWVEAKQIDAERAQYWASTPRPQT